ncbi:MAG: response regulator [Spirochaetales bacterium]
MPTRILIADDEELERKAIRKILERETDWELYEAENGLEALALVGKVSVTVVLLDIKMPGLDGIAVAERLRAEYPDVAVIFLTAYDQFDYARSALRLQVDEFLLKPASAKEVLASVWAVLSRVASREGQRQSSQEALQRLDSAITLVAGRLRDDLSAGLTDSDQVSKFLNLQNLAGGPLLVFECRATVAGSPLNPVATLAEALFTVGETVALAGVRGLTVRVLCLGEDGKQDPLPLLKRFRETVRSETGVSLWVGAAVAGGEPVGLDALVTAAHRAATLANASNPILVVTVGGRPGLGAAPGLPLVVTKALAMLEDRMTENLSLDEVALALGLSPSHLSRQLARATGNGFAECLAHFRIASAKSYLTKGSQTIKEVAHLVGYHDPAYFARVFRRLEGCSPADFRAGIDRQEASKSTK